MGSEWREFDPDRHGRDAHGEFSSMLKRTAPGAHVALPDKTEVVHHVDGGFDVRSRADRLLSHYENPEDAAKHALDASSQSLHPSSLGGSKNYGSFKGYLAGGGRHSLSRIGSLV